MRDLNKDAYNKIAEDWHRDRLSDDWWVPGTKKFISYLKPREHVLDVGCGSGIKAKFFVENGLRVTGIDISESFINIAEREVSEGTFFVLHMGEAERLGKVFDGVFAHASLLHIPKIEVQKILRILVKVLKPKGYFYLAVKELRDGDLEERVEVRDDYGYNYKRFFSYFRMEEVKNYLKDVGLELVFDGTSRVGNTNWLQVIAQK